MRLPFMTGLIFITALYGMDQQDRELMALARNYHEGNNFNILINRLQAQLEAQDARREAILLINYVHRHGEEVPSEFLADVHTSALTDAEIE